MRATTMLRRRKSLSDMEAAEKKTSGWKQLSQRGLLQQPSGGQSTYVLESSGKRICACVSDSAERLCKGARLSFDVNAKTVCNYTQGSSFHVLFGVHGSELFHAIR